MANILIVEDEKKMQDIIAVYLRRGGHTCFIADDGVDALMLLKNTPLDLMILDIMMPHLGGGVREHQRGDNRVSGGAQCLCGRSGDCACEQGV